MAIIVERKSDGVLTSLGGFSADPSSAKEGDAWYNTTDDQIKAILGSVIRVLGDPAGALQQGKETLTISSGAITPTGNASIIVVDAETGTTDDLVNIATTNIPDYKVIWITHENLTDTITLKHENISPAGNLSLDGQTDKSIGTDFDLIPLMRRGDLFYQCGPKMDLAFFAGA